VADRFAAHLHARGIRPGDFVAIFTTNSPEMVLTVYALAKLGAVAAMINTSLRGKLIGYLLLIMC
jgi:acyl-CoA synthetase (AMP-forming)/AMP-acid ligase II